MEVEKKQSTLPAISEALLDENYKPIYEIRDGHIVLKQAQAISISGTYIGPNLLDTRTADRMQEASTLPWVLSEIYSDATNPDVVAGYLIVDQHGKPQLVSMSRLAEYLDNLPAPLANAVQDVNYIFGKQLKLTTQVHRIFTYYPDKSDDQDKGFRNADGSIKTLLPDRVSRPWFCSLTYKDFRRLYDYYNQLIFENKLCQAVMFRWLEDSKQPTFVEIKLEPESDVLKADYIEGYKVGSVVIHINREFFKNNPHLFLELFIHDLIHCLGIPGYHNPTFSRYCELARAKVKDLDILDIDLKEVTEAKGKWATISDLGALKTDTHDTVAMLCPICGNLMKPGRNNTSICIQGHTLKHK